MSLTVALAMEQICLRVVGKVEEDEERDDKLELVRVEDEGAKRKEKERGSVRVSYFRKTGRKENVGSGRRSDWDKRLK